MGPSNKGVPEPINCNPEENHPQNDSMEENSDTDEENHELAGYEPLPMVPPEEIDEISSDSDNDSGVDSGEQGHEDPLPPINRIENQLIGEVWSAPTPSAVDINMDSNKVDEVKQAMANIKLPPNSIPEWANNIPEDQWKQHLLNRLSDLQKVLK